MQKAVRFFGCVITLCLTIGLLIIMTDLTERKDSDEKYQDFFQDRDYDVLFFGSSHVINGVFPMELWNDYGIVSYNFGGHGNRIATSYWVMENALDYVTPKIIVIDCWGLSHTTKCPGPFSQVHVSFDAFPLSLTKIKATLDLLNDSTMEELIAKNEIATSTEPRTKIGLLWDFSAYHSRWSELNQDDFSISSNLEKGAESRINVTRGTLNRIDPNKKQEPGYLGETYLCKMIEDCQKRGISTVLIYLPYPAYQNDQKDANRVYAIAEKYGIPYINFLAMDDMINFQTDLYDSKSHLNPSGARKITSYLGKYLTQLFNLPDRRTDPDYSYWAQDYLEYEALKDKNLTDQNDIINYLMLLSGDSLDTIIYIKNKEIFHSQWGIELLNNIGISTNDLNENVDFLLYSNQERKATALYHFAKDGKKENTSFGNASLTRIESADDGKKAILCLTIDGWEDMHIEENNNLGMQINVYRHGNLIDSVKFEYDVDSSSETINTLSAIR